MKKINRHLFTVLFTFSSLFVINNKLWGQTEISINPNPTLLAQCPLTPIVYIISNWNNACHSVSVEQGTSTDEDFYNSNGDLDPTKRKLIVNWFDQSNFKGKIKIIRSASTSCNSSAADKTFEVPIKSLNNLTPTLTPPDTEYNTGISMNISYTAYLEYPMRGPNDPNPLLCTVFNWTLPQGWNLASPPGTATTGSITVTTSATTG